MNFYDAIPTILKHEGGYVNDPDDPGGETNYGISKRAFPGIDIKGLTEKQAALLYREYYWNKWGVKHLPEQYRLIYFDMLVNMGPKGAALVLQRALNHIRQLVEEDGSFGPKTLAALRQNLPPVDLIKAYRLKRYIDIIKRRPSSKKFLLGWYRRAISVG